MKNNMKLRVICNALEIDAAELIEIFELEGMIIDEEKAEALLTATVEEVLVNQDDDDDELEFSEELIDEEVETIETSVAICDNPTFETFLNGYITYRRGAPEPKDGVVEKRELVMTSPKNVNNTILKKLKIALSLTNDDVIDILSEVGMTVTKGELTPLFRKEGHKHYKKCSDRLLMAFIDGIGVMTRS